MAARAMASGTISFGLVSIPVRLYSTVDTTKSIRFNYLTEDGARVRQQYVRGDDGEPVGRDELDLAIKIIDLMDALKASVSAKGKSTRKPAKRAPKKRAAARKTRRQSKNG